MTATSAPVPVPKGVPAWLVRVVSLLVAAAGVALAWVDPTGKLDTPGIQALVILVFLAVGLVIFTAHLVLGAVHEYGWSKQAFIDVESHEMTEAKAVWPQIKTEWEAAKPAVDQLADIAQLQAAVAGVDQKIRDAVASIPPPDIDALATAVSAKLGEALTKPAG